MTKTLLLLLLLPFSLLAQRLDIHSPIRYLALGDSYTIGESVPSADNWPHQLSDSLAVRSITTDSLKIIATTGWRTDNLLAAIQNQGLDSGHFNLVSLLIGVNNQYQGRLLSQYITELPRLIDSAIRYAGGDTAHVFIVSIPDYAYTPFGVQNGNQAQISMQLDTYNLIGKQFADSFHIRYFDITPISHQGLNDPTLVAPDGLHPSGKQYSLWIKLILQTVDSTTAVSTGITNTTADDGITSYPNPVKDKMTLSMKDADATIEIVNIMGQEVLRETLTSSHTIDLTDIHAGLYTVKISTPKSQWIKKVIKE